MPTHNDTLAITETTITETATAALFQKPTRRYSAETRRLVQRMLNISKLVEQSRHALVALAGHAADPVAPSVAPNEISTPATTSEPEYLPTADPREFRVAGGMVSEDNKFYPACPEAAFDRPMCLEAAVGSIATMLGPEFAATDTYPTRVRLPAPPLMLVDRIMSIDAESRSMTTGNIVTQHIVNEGAWYLDHNCIPTGICVESGQADLFLAGVLGIDLQTKGLATYRLLDAEVTFHRGLPNPGETITYDIYADGFSSQGDTTLYRFHYDATVNGEPLLSMRGGTAGFFTQQELAAGVGIVHSALSQKTTTRNYHR